VATDDNQSRGFVEGHIGKLEDAVELVLSKFQAKSSRVTGKSRKLVGVLRSRVAEFTAELEILEMREKRVGDESTTFREQLLRTAYHPQHWVDPKFLQKQRMII
jgi:hypothetical protein